MIAVLLLASLATVETFRISHPGAGFDVRITAPSGAGPFPVIVWSHGLGGSKDAYQPLVHYWVEHGYVVIQPTHADSLQLSRGSLKDRTGNWKERPQQISAVIDELPNLARDLPQLNGKIDAKRVGVGGHSFGAHTSQLVAGANLRLYGTSFRDNRPLAFVWISPQGPGGILTTSSWSEIHRPVLMISGDNDSSPIDGRPASWRREVWTNLATGDKYLLWVNGAHHGFGGISGRIPFPGSGPQDPKQVQAVQEATTAFWDCYLKTDLRFPKNLHIDSTVATLTRK